MKEARPILLMCLIVVVSVLIALQGLAVSKTHDTIEDLPSSKERTDLIELSAVLDELPREDRAVLISIGYHESKFHDDVCTGEILGDAGRAYGCFQSHDPDRSGGVRGQVERAARDVRRARNYCAARGHNEINAVFSLYGTGRTCVHRMPNRVATYERVLGRL